MNQLVSIIVPCYNQAQFLPDALDSIINQSFTNWECIIVNDGSKDNTNEVIKEWLNKDNRLSYIEIVNKGVSNARNIGIEAAKGIFILPLDADDKISNNYIELALLEFKQNPLLKVVYSNAEKFGVEEGLWNLKPFSLGNLARANMIFCSGIYRKEEWKRVGGYDTDMVQGLEDWEFWIAILKDGGFVKQINKVCFYYRIKQSSRNKSFNESQKKELLDFITSKHSGFYNSILGNPIELNKSILKKQKEIDHLKKSKKNALNILFEFVFGVKLFNK